jgi:hypothetical protein
MVSLCQERPLRTQCPGASYNDEAKGPLLVHQVHGRHLEMPGVRLRRYRGPLALFQAIAGAAGGLTVAAGSAPHSDVDLL